MAELTHCEEVYGKRTLTNGNTVWFGVYTGQHIYKQKELDFNMPKPDKNKGVICDG